MPQYITLYIILYVAISNQFGISLPYLDAGLDRLVDYRNYDMLGFFAVVRLNLVLSGAGTNGLRSAPRSRAPRQSASGIGIVRCSSNPSRSDASYRGVLVHPGFSLPWTKPFVVPWLTTWGLTFQTGHATGSTRLECWRSAHSRGPVKDRYSESSG